MLHHISEGGGGGYSHFISYIGSGLASTVHPPPPNILEISSTPKIFEIWATPNNIPYHVPWPSEKTLNAKKWPLNIVQFCDDPKIYPQNVHTQKIFIFLKTEKILKFKIWTQKMTRASVCMKISELPPPPPRHHILCMFKQSWTDDLVFQRILDFCSHRSVEQWRLRRACATALTGQSNLCWYTQRIKCPFRGFSRIPIDTS